MTTFVAFLRAINVAGHASVKMSDLRTAFGRAGGRDVRTLIQSGNVLFEAPAKEAAQVVRKAGNRLRVTSGTEPEIVWRSVLEIETLMKAAPFKDLGAAPGVKLYVAFLSRKPRSLPTLPLISSREALEAIAATAREVFIVSRPKKSGFFGFPNNFVEEQLGVSATTRNWSTITKIVELARSRTDG